MDIEELTDNFSFCETWEERYGKNLKFRLNVNFGAVTQQKRLMQLGAFGFDRMGRNVDFTLKNAFGISADHTFYQL